MVVNWLMDLTLECSILSHVTALFLWKTPLPLQCLQAATATLKIQSREDLKEGFSVSGNT